MNFIRKQCETDDDYWRIRRFFRSLSAVDVRPTANWDVCDFDYWRWHTLESVWERSPRELRYWENQEEEIVGVLVYGDPGVCHPMADPAVATEDLLHQMLETAESEFLLSLDDGRRLLFPWAGTEDALLNSVLEVRGYELHASGHSTQYHGWQSLLDGPPSAQALDGYSLRSMGSDDYSARSLASWRVFHPGEPDEGADPVGDWYANVQRAPLYRRDLDIVAIDDATSEMAAFSTGYFDDVARIGNILLSGAVPAHPHEELECWTVTELLSRLHRLGAVGCSLTWFESDPGDVYTSAGFDVHSVSKVWKKTF